MDQKTLHNSDISGARKNVKDIKVVGNDSPLSCPFCRSKRLHVPFEGSGYFVECKDCGATGPDDSEAQDPDADYFAAVRAWNTRSANAEIRGMCPKEKDHE